MRTCILYVLERFRFCFLLTCINQHAFESAPNSQYPSIAGRSKRVLPRFCASRGCCTHVRRADVRRAHAGSYAGADVRGARDAQWRRRTCEVGVDRFWGWSMEPFPPMELGMDWGSWVGEGLNGCCSLRSLD